MTCKRPRRFALYQHFVNEYPRFLEYQKNHLCKAVGFYGGVFDTLVLKSRPAYDSCKPVAYHTKREGTCLSLSFCWGETRERWAGARIAATWYYFNVKLIMIEQLLICPFGDCFEMLT